MIGVIRTVMGVLGYRSSAIEKKLGWKAGYLSRLLNGVMELRFEHVLDIAAAMELRPGELFSIAYPEPDGSPSPSAQRLREATGGFREPAQASAATEVNLLTEEQMERVLGRALHRLLRVILERYGKEIDDGSRG